VVDAAELVGDRLDACRDPCPEQTRAVARSGEETS
jgi:hypothetical protein